MNCDVCGKTSPTFKTCQHCLRDKITKKAADAATALKFPCPKDLEEPTKKLDNLKGISAAVVVPEELESIIRGERKEIKVNIKRLEEEICEKRAYNTIHHDWRHDFLTLTASQVSYLAKGIGYGSFKSLLLRKLEARRYIIPAPKKIALQRYMLEGQKLENSVILNVEALFKDRGLVRVPVCEGGTGFQRTAGKIKALATPDMLLVDEQGRWLLVEIKCHFSRYPLTSKKLSGYASQVIWQMYVVKGLEGFVIFPYALLAIYLPRENLIKIYKVPYDDEYISETVKKGNDERLVESLVELGQMKELTVKEDF